MATFVVRVAHFKITDGDRQVSALVAMLSAGRVVTIQKNDEKVVMFDILPPRGTPDTQEWADTLAECMADCGYNAVRAPAWEEGSENRYAD
jgi:hypothetical protein